MIYNVKKSEIISKSTGRRYTVKKVNRTLHYKEILVNNPINEKSIEQLIDEIKLCNFSFLIINIGAHNFESIEVMKDLKNRLNLEKDTLSRFRKIAF